MGMHDNDRARGRWAGMTITEQGNEDSGMRIKLNGTKWKQTLGALRKLGLLRYKRARIQCGTLNDYSIVFVCLNANTEKSQNESMSSVLCRF